jgi:hypothetical protein
MVRNEGDVVCENVEHVGGSSLDSEIRRMSIMRDGDLQSANSCVQDLHLEALHSPSRRQTHGIPKPDPLYQTPLS